MVEPMGALSTKNCLGSKHPAKSSFVTYARWLFIRSSITLSMLRRIHSLCLKVQKSNTVFNEVLLIIMWLHCCRSWRNMHIDCKTVGKCYEVVRGKGWRKGLNDRRKTNTGILFPKECSRKKGPMVNQLSPIVSCGSTHRCTRELMEELARREIELTTNGFLTHASVNSATDRTNHESHILWASIYNS